MITMQQFLEGETLVYRRLDKKQIEATYRVGVGVFLESDGEDLGTAAVIDDVGAKRVYSNLTGGIGSGEVKAGEGRPGRPRNTEVPAKKARREAP